MLFLALLRFFFKKKRSSSDVTRSSHVLSSVCLDVQISLNWNYSHSFLGRPFTCSGIVDLPKAQKTVERIFVSFAPFRIYGPKMPKKCPKSAVVLIRSMIALFCHWKSVFLEIGCIHAIFSLLD